VQAPITLNVGGNLIVDGGSTTQWRQPVVASGGVVKNGSGRLNLFADNNYGGGTVLNRGILGLGDDDALGRGDLVINDGAVTAIGGPRTIDTRVWSTPRAWPWAAPMI